MRKVIFVISLILVFALRIQVLAKNSPLIIFAAASTTELMKEIKTEYYKNYTKEISISFASSSTLAKQIQNGAPAHIYISANSLWMDYLIKNNAVIKSSNFILMRNSLCIIASLQSKIESTEFKAILTNFKGRLAMGDPDHVPAGMYAKETLKSLALWNSLKTRIAAANNVKHALLFVEKNECELGIVYITDALNNKNVKIIKEIPQNLHKKIVYPVSKTKEKHSDQEIFMEFLKTDKIVSIIKKYGFKPGDDSDD